MFTHHVSKLFWGEAILTASSLINKFPQEFLISKTPLNTLLSFYPQTRLFTNLHVKTFGCTTFVHTSKLNLNKLEPRAIKCIFLCYSPNKKGYKCYCLTTRKMFVTLDVTFFEEKSYYLNPHLQGKKVNKDSCWIFSFLFPI